MILSAAEKILCGRFFVYPIKNIYKYSDIMI